MDISRIRRRFLTAVALLTCTVALVGCNTKAEFSRNEAYMLSFERKEGVDLSDQRRSDLDQLLSGLFGTPDDPGVPALVGTEVKQVIDINKLHFAAGAVGSDEQGRARGLYREHCAHCHGVTGDGAGPTAVFLNPYPRDYRRGTFKFKSTPRQSKPTHDDLKQILLKGIPDTAMPSFRTLPDNEIEALIHYVRYLSIRGEAERSIVQFAMLDLEPADPQNNISEDRLFDLGGDDRAERAEDIRGLVAEIVEKWISAESEAKPIAPPSWAVGDSDHELSHEKKVELLKRGRELFYGKVAACVKCHGDSALGDGQTTDFDDWTKELEPLNAEALAAYRNLGDFVFKPRNIRPRNLRLGHYRGGRRPIDIYRRVFNGIDGTPMPALSAVLKNEGEAKVGVTHDDIWALVYYVRSLPYESISQPTVVAEGYQRDRQ